MKQAILGVFTSLLSGSLLGLGVCLRVKGILKKGLGMPGKEVFFSYLFKIAGVSSAAFLFLFLKPVHPLTYGVLIGSVFGASCLFFYGFDKK